MKVSINFQEIFFENPFNVEPIGPFIFSDIIKESEMILIRDYGLIKQDNYWFDIKDKDKFLILQLTHPELITEIKNK